MRYISRQEMYSWMSESYPEFADAQIPDDMHQKLCDAITSYKNVCAEIYQYLDRNPEFEIKA